MSEHSENMLGIPEARELASLQAQMQRPAQNANTDGGFELGWGTALLCFGLGPYFTALVTQSTWFLAWTSWICFLPLICAGFAPYAVPKMIKRFITWPRTGYVVNPNDIKLSQLVMLKIPPVILCIGSVWFLSGAITLMLFMRRNPVPSAETP